MKPGCISFTVDSGLCLLREDFLRICEGEHCAAFVLGQIYYWYDNKLKHLPQARATNAAAVRNDVLPSQDEELWIYKSISDMQKELLNLFGEKAVSEGFAYLIEKEFLLTRMNPRFQFDKTRQYLFNREKVQEAIQEPYQPQECGFVKKRAKRPQTVAINRNNAASSTATMRDGSRNNAAAIPETTTEPTNPETPALRAGRAPEIQKPTASSSSEPSSEPASMFDCFDLFPPSSEKPKPVKPKMPEQPSTVFYRRYAVLTGGCGNISLDKREIKIFFTTSPLNPTLEETWSAYDEWYRFQPKDMLDKGCYRMYHFEKFGGNRIITEARRIASGEDDEQMRQIKEVLARKKPAESRFDRLEV